MADGRRRRAERPRETGGWSPRGIALSIALHLLAIGLIFLAPHRITPSQPTAYTVELVDPNALGGKLLAGPIGGADAKPKPQPKAPPPPPPEPPRVEPPPPDQVARADQPPAIAPDEDDEAVPLGTPRATATPRLAPTPQATKPATARPSAPPSPRASASAIASPKPKPSATVAIVVAAKETPNRRPANVPATPAAEARPKAHPTAAPADDLDGKLADAIKGVEAKVERAEKAGVGGANQPGGGMGGTERRLDGPAGIGGEGPGGGGTVRGLEFVVYYNQMLNRIKERWTWVGTRSDLHVTIHFSILPSGEITDIRLMERSGDQGYDASVERAVKTVGSLPPPPEVYRSDFANVELTFRPADLQR